MANVTTTGTTGYPGAIDTRTSLTDGSSGDTIVANHPNGLGAAVLAVENELGTDPAGSLADVKTRLDVSQNSDGTIRSTVVAAGPGTDVTYASGVFTISGTPEGPGSLQNVGIELTPNRSVTNQLGIRLVQRDGSTPTATSPSRISFHAATSTSPGYQIATATTNTELLLSSGSTLGFLASQRGRMYFWAILATPTIELAVSRNAVFQESLLQNTTAEGAAGGADSDSLLYSTSARTNVPVRCLAYADFETGSTPGQWATAPFFGSLLGPGSKRTGDVIQIVSTLTSTSTSGTTVMPLDSTIPQITEGFQVITQAITPTSELNILEIEAQSLTSKSDQARTQMAMFIGSQTNTIGGCSAGSANDEVNTLSFKLATIAGIASSVTFSMRVGATGAGTVIVNGNSATARPWMGGKENTYIIIKEIMA